MHIEELFRRLSYGELSNLSLGLEGAGSIQENKHEMLIQYTNEALLRLYARFLLREDDLVLECSEHITNYYLLKQFAKTNKTPCPGTTLYIRDREHEPFVEDVIKVLGVYDRFNKQLPLNDTERPDSLFTPQPNVLQIPNPVEGEPLAVTYHAMHPRLPYDKLDSCIELPEVLSGALTAHIAYQVYSNMNGQENAIKAAEHMNRYESICANVVAMDLVSASTSSTNQKFNQRGFI